MNIREEARLFGTDGIRGKAGEYPLTDGMLFKIGLSIAKVIYYKNNREKNNYSVLIGRDTRLSGKRIERILAEGINSCGISVLSVGIVPTPALSFLTHNLGANMGIMISASHNRASDNGIKFFNEDGFKLSHEDETWMENVIFDNLIYLNEDKISRSKGSFIMLSDAYQRYRNFLLLMAKGINLKGKRIGIDCGGGALCYLGEDIFRQLGAEAITINNNPNGESINEGGAVNPHHLRDLVLENKLDLGVSFDGDGDRVIFVDEDGSIIDGDYILAILGRHFLKKNRLPKKTIVATVMSNMGLKISMDNIGIKVLTTKVGDKFVVNTLLKNGLNLGGEPSGHIIFLDHLPSPDGLLTAIEMMRVISERQTSLKELSKCMEKYPQILVNVEVSQKKPFEEFPRIINELKESEKKLENRGRIVLRYSGTENLARVMVEGKDKQEVKEIAHTIAELIKEEIG